ncbi:MAG TPA: cytochrome c oxidase accessory protein CcoG, partial [Planctomycetota bacterium]|nr:cytochrome c oxidase accessory protein CcoG [Planctomycetota bacterium]
RVWCGWACPQTVYMEFLYRPIERLMEGKHYQSPERHKMPKWRLVAKYAIFLVLSLHLANTFLSWFVGTDKIIEWTRQSPLEHPTPFLVVFVTTGLMMWDFAFWREQMCTLACPYARFQSVLLDRSSLIVGYDAKRGEPRGNARRLAAQGIEAGDCVDCHNCVTTCPTGIDIRNGLQLECIACTQCIDACDEVMDKVGKPRGLIRYGSQSDFAGEPKHRLRPRVVLYPLLLAGVLTALVFSVASRGEAQLEFLRSRGQNPYRTLESGEISNVVSLHITNRTDHPATYDIRLKGEGTLIKPQFPLEVPGQTGIDANIQVVLPAAGFHDGRKSVEMELIEGERVLDTAERQFLGPLFD